MRLVVSIGYTMVIRFSYGVVDRILYRLFMKALKVVTVEVDSFSTLSRFLSIDAVFS